MEGNNYIAECSASATAGAVARPARGVMRRAVVGLAMSTALVGGASLAPAMMPVTIAQETGNVAAPANNLATPQDQVALTLLEGRAITPVTITVKGFAEGTTARLDGLPPGMSYTPVPVAAGSNTSQSVLTGTPTQTGFFEVRAVAVDSNGREILNANGQPIFETFTIRVIPVEVTLQATPSTQTVEVGQPIIPVLITAGKGFSVTDATFDPSTLPPGVTMNSQTGQLRGTANVAGRYVTEFRLHDEPSGKSATAIVKFDVREAAPTAEPTESTTAEPTAKPTESQPPVPTEDTATPTEDTVTPTESTAAPTTEPITDNPQPTDAIEPTETPSQRRTESAESDISWPEPNSGPDDPVITPSATADRPPSEDSPKDRPAPQDGAQQDGPQPPENELPPQDQRNRPAPQGQSRPQGQQSRPAPQSQNQPQRNQSAPQSIGPRIEIRAAGIIGADERNLLGRLTARLSEEPQAQAGEQPQAQAPASEGGRPIGDFGPGRGSGSSKPGANGQSDDGSQLSNEAYGYPGASAGSRGPVHLDNGESLTAAAATVAVTLVAGGTLLNLRRRL
ncbi:hypothetical protein [Corynebacterium resistens]|uniref:hypothetical protein n=1 Tax=Corynebacterium resistens TaxID=258224 RepID=UPI002353E7D2|nr:hypothetical protein [Corynebacterium resistens]